MTKYAKRKPHQLSGGQQQRIALARSLAKRPKILLLDEPLGALDKKLRQQTQLELVNTLEQVGVTCIMVTHDQEEAMTMATRIAIMSEGQLQQVGTPSAFTISLTAALPPNLSAKPIFLTVSSLMTAPISPSSNVTAWKTTSASTTVWAFQTTMKFGSASALKTLICTKKNRNT